MDINLKAKDTTLENDGYFQIEENQQVNIFKHNPKDDKLIVSLEYCRFN